MKIRSIRPEFFADPKMVKLSAEARVLYMGLWCYVDDEGRGEYLPKRIEGEVFPLEDVAFDTLWSELEDLGRVVRYHVGGHDYFHIPTFERWQKPNRKYESKLPPPPSNTEDAARTQRVDTDAAHAVEGEGEGVVEVVTSAAPDVPEVPAKRNGRNPHYDAVCAALDMPERGEHEGLFGKIAARAQRQGHEPDEILNRAAAHLATFNFPLTPGSLNKRWDELGSKVVTATPAERKQVQQHMERMRRRIQILQGGDP